MGRVHATWAVSDQVGPYSAIFTSGWVWARLGVVSNNIWPTQAKSRWPGPTSDPTSALAPFCSAALVDLRKACRELTQTQPSLESCGHLIIQRRNAPACSNNICTMLLTDIPTVLTKFWLVPTKLARFRRTRDDSTKLGVLWAESEPISTCNSNTPVRWLTSGWRNQHACEALQQYEFGNDNDTHCTCSLACGARDSWFKSRSFRSQRQTIRPAGHELRTHAFGAHGVRERGKSSDKC